MGGNRAFIGEVACLGLLAGAGGLILFGAVGLPGPEYDPLGPAGMPRYIAYALLLLSIIRIAQIVLETRRDGGDAAEPVERPPQITKMAYAGAIILAYLLIISVGGLPFSIVTLVFLVLAGFTMTDFDKSKLPIVIGIAVVVSFGLTYIFRNVLNVILPG